MQIIEDYSLWRNKYGLQENNKLGHTSQNPVRWTAQYLVALIMYSYGKNYSPVEEFDRIKSIIPFKERGLLLRDPSSLEQDSIDNYIAVGFIASVISLQIAKDILDYGSKHLRFYCTNGFTWKGYLGRFPQLFAHLKWALGQEPNWFERMAWYLSVYIGANSTSQDSKILTWFLILVSEDENNITKWLSKRFKQKLREQYPHGIGQVLKEYYHDQDDHPDVKYLWDVF